MASEKSAVASGADFDGARRRNVPASSTNGLAVDKVEIDDKKSQVKKVSESHSTFLSASIIHWQERLVPNDLC